jgi:hypothetical protein
VAREHQAAVSAVIEALAVERNEAAAHRNELSRHAGDVAKAGKEACADVQKAASGAARQAVVESIQATSGAICEAFGSSSEPVLAQLSHVGLPRSALKNRGNPKSWVPCRKFG